MEEREATGRFCFWMRGTDGPTREVDYLEEASGTFENRETTMASRWVRRYRHDSRRSRHR
jgi:hypothetical protein